MPQYKMVVMSNPMEGREDECNDWYQNVHLPEVVALPGVKSAQRFRLARNMMEGDTHRYAAIYDIETDNIDAMLQEFMAAAEDGRLNMSDALDRENAHAAIYEEFGPVVKAE